MGLWRYQVSTRLILCGTFCAALFACAVAHAESLAEIAVRFEQKGLPNVSNARYVELSAFGWESEFRHHLPAFEWETSGNAWLLEETRDTAGRIVKGRFASAGGGAYEVRRRAAEEDIKYDEDPAEAVGEWGSARLARDVKLTLRCLEAEEKNAEEYHAFSEQGEVLLFALYLRQRGAAESAETILAKLRKLEKKPGEAERAALNVLADSQYTMLYRRFRLESNWPDYRDGILALLAKYPKEWELEPALRLLLKGVELRADKQMPALAARDGMAAEDKALAEGLLTLKEVGKSPFPEAHIQVPWLVPETWTNRVDLRGSADLALRARGLKALPLLLALTSDKTLTEIAVEQVRGQHAVSPFDWERDQKLDAGESGFKQMKRPATVGELAVKIVTELFPASLVGESWNRKSHEEVLKIAREFDAKYRDASPDTLAVFYLQQEYGDFNPPALAYLLRVARQRPLPEFETFLTEKADLIEEYGSAKYEPVAKALVAYVAVRGVDAQPLIKKFSDRLDVKARSYRKPDNVSYGGDKENKEHEEKMRDGLRQTAQLLAGLRFDVPDSELLSRVAGGGKDANPYEGDMLSTRLGMRPLDRALALLLKKAVGTEVPDVRQKIAGLLRTRISQDAGTTSAQLGLQPTANAESWKALASDERSGEHYLTCYLRLFDADHIQKDDTSRALDAEPTMRACGERGRTLIRQRVFARLDGLPAEQLPKYPGEVTLSAEQRASCVLRLTETASREQAAAGVAAFSVYELAALPDLFKQEPRLAAKMAGFANTVVSVSVQGDDAAVLRLEKWKGRHVSPELVAELADLCAMRTKAGRPLFCLLERKPNLDGCEVSVRPAEANKGQKRGCMGYSGVVCDAGVYEGATWRTASPPAETNWGTFLPSASVQLRSFQQGVAQLCSGTNSPSSAGFVRLMTEGERE